jgi:hypothetical protein
LEKVLSEDIKLSPFTYLGETVYLYLLNQNMKIPGGLLNSLSVLEEYLEQKQVHFEKNNEAVNLYSLLHKVQPSWLDIPDWYMKKIMEAAGSISGKHLECFLRERIKQDFRCLKKQPKWLQSAQWVYENEEPLLFIGQIEITDIRNDTAQLYVFLDERNNKFHTIEQIA